MSIENAKKAQELLEEIEKLSGYKKLLADKDHGRIAHFQFVQHYGRLGDYDYVVIDHKYNSRFLPELEKIISEMESEIKAL